VAGGIRLGLLGGLILLTVLFFPGGIMQIVDRAGAALRGRRGRSADEPGEAGRERVAPPAREDVRADAGAPRPLDATARTED
jgi:hypothetical protein